MSLCVEPCESVGNIWEIISGAYVKNWSNARDLFIVAWTQGTEKSEGTHGIFPLVILLVFLLTNSTDKSKRMRGILSLIWLFIVGKINVGMRRRFQWIQLNMVLWRWCIFPAWLLKIGWYILAFICMYFHANLFDGKWFHGTCPGDVYLWLKSGGG